MTKKELTVALEPLTDIQALADYMLGLPEKELETLPLAPLRRHARKHDIDITTGEIGELLKELLEAEKIRPHFERIGNAVITPIKWIIKGILEAGGFCMVYGDSGTYKTFFAVAMAAAIALGWDFYNYHTKKGAVYYIAAEGSAGLIRRFRAWAQENRAVLTDAPIYRYTAAPDLLNNSVTLELALETAIDTESEPPRLAIIDTWSRALAGDDSDTTSATEGLKVLDRIRAKYPGLSILIVHHTGHREKTRARGASLIHAAVDSEFRLEKSGSNITFVNTKSKESELLPLMAFNPRKVNLIADNGRNLLDEDGEIETSVVLDKTEYIPLVVEGNLGKNQERILEVMGGLGDKNILAESLFRKIKERFGMRKDAFDKAILGLENRGILCTETGFICLA
jgi:KaiC/GvpD/RAD55 family RecA-like ATPase